ncbi:MAG TPA: ABC transporter ATP-binding protein [Verrucomicrobiae bacterium]
MSIWGDAFLGVSPPFLDIQCFPVWTTLWQVSHIHLMSRLVIENLSKRFKDSQNCIIDAVRQFSLQIESGELFVLLGPSGSGKTTLLRLLAGLEEPDSGTIYLNEKLISATPPAKRNLAMVFQGDALYPHLTASENISLGLKLRKVPSAEIAARVHETAELLHLTQLLQRRPHELSGGERQRVSLARAIARRPEVYLLDEPLSSLDAPLRSEMRGELLKIQKELKVTMLYVTHDQTEAMSMGNHVAIMQRGELQQTGTVQEIYRRPANVFVARFFGLPPMNLIAGRLSEAHGRFGFRPSASPKQFIKLENIPVSRNWQNRDVLLGIRPEHISITDAFVENGLPAAFDYAEWLGPETLLHVRSGSQSFILRAKAHENLPQAGAAVRLTVDTEHALLFDPLSGQPID